MTQAVTCPACGCRLRVEEERAERRLTCPRCLSRIEIHDAGLKRAPRLTVAHSVDREVQSGLNTTYYCVLALTVLIIVGILGWFWLEQSSANWELAALGGALCLTLPFLVLDVLVLIPIGKWLFRWADKPAATIASQSLRIVGAVLALVAAAVAVFVFFFVACWASVGGFPP